MRFAAGYVVDNETSTIGLVQKVLAKYDVTKVQELTHGTAIGLTFRCNVCKLAWSSWVQFEWSTAREYTIQRVVDCAESQCSAHRCDLDLGPAGRP